MKNRKLWYLYFVIALVLVACTAVENEQVEVTDPAPMAGAPTALVETKEPAATEMSVVAEPQTGDLEAFIVQLETAATTQNYAEMQALMSDPVAVGGWRSEWRLYTPDQMIAEFQNGTLPAPLAVQFTGLSDAEITQLIGQPPATMFGPETNMVAALHSSGWGQSAADDAILFVIEKDGAYSWNAFLYTNGRFADANLDLIAAPVGLIYIVWGEGIYQVQTDGSHRQIADAATASIPNLMVSPDGRYIAYLNDAQELWLINNATGDQQQLAAGVTLSGYLLWGDSDTLFTGVWLDPGEAEGPNNGHISTLDINSGHLQILDESRLSGGRPALLSDYNWAAFDVFPAGSDDITTGRHYHPDSGLQIFDQTAYAGNTGNPIGNPAWSPDPNKIAWLSFAGERTVVQVFDVEAKTAVTLFDWDPARFGALIPSPMWSPAGKWLLLEVWANGPEGSGIWLLAPDGSSQTLIDGQGKEPYWANENQVVFGLNDGPRLYDLTSGETFKLDLPAGSWQLGVTPLDDLLALSESNGVDETSVEFVLAVQDVPMYDGPGLTYQQIGIIFDGQIAKVTGQDSASGWWRIICPDDTVGSCWVTADSTYTQPIENPAAANPAEPPQSLTIVQTVDSPDGLWQATVAQSEPTIVAGESKFYTTLSVTNGSAVWTPIDEWRGHGLGYVYPTIQGWSDDGRYLYYSNLTSFDGCMIFNNGMDLHQLDVTNGRTDLLLDTGLTNNLALSPDGTQVAYTQFNEQDVVVFLRDVATGKEQSVAVTTGTGDAQSGNILWSPDGSFFLLVVAHNPCSADRTHSIVRVDVMRNGLTAVTFIEQNDRQFAILDWPDPAQAQVRLKDKDGNTWLLAADSGQLTPEE